jgi:hypothetical protein
MFSSFHNNQIQSLFTTKPKLNDIHTKANNHNVSKPPTN